ncbi:hypothetical protein NECAME_07272 [Necator americanus]|uniref:Uncharacterized protein n=1 Tax=Necator americanus TaxID=51031 RepID=W2TRK3_NECAM|nr:hypothetical protein NECAME_07272 [Necator americanus]ETN83667.1 hypothetical protein NECAME_07272 [Necator americanus]
MDERRQSRLTYDDRRGSRLSRRGTLADIVVSSHHLCPPQWYGVGFIEDYQPSLTTPTDNPIGWAMFNPLPIRGPTQRPRNRTIGMSKLLLIYFPTHHSLSLDGSVWEGEEQ